MPEVQRRAAITMEKLERKPLAVSCKTSRCAYFAREKSKAKELERVSLQRTRLQGIYSYDSKFVLMGNDAYL